MAAATVAEGIELLSGATEPSLVLLSATLVQPTVPDFEALLALRPRPVITLMCTYPVTCPLNPGVACPQIGCIRKPDDVVPQKLLPWVQGILARGFDSRLAAP